MPSQLKTWMRRQLAQVPVFKTLLERRDLHKQFALERQLLDGVHYTTNTHRSIIHFSVHKSATQFVKRILRRCAMANGMYHVQMNEYLSHETGKPYLHYLSAEEMSAYRHIFKIQGYLYSVFAGLVEGIPHLDAYHSILMVRDPRDALTSEFFSIAHSHQPPAARDKREVFMQRRDKAREVGIDDYVISESERVRECYQKYLDSLVPLPSVFVTKYEDMIADFSVWLERLMSTCNLAIDDLLRNDLINEAQESRPISEDVTKHVRQVIPGDHRRKLEPKTIAYLNDLLRDVLDGFDYPLD